MKRILSIVLLIACLLALAVPAAAAAPDLQELVNGTAKYMVSVVKEPDHANIGGEWAVLGLARSGYPVPDGYYEGFYGKVEAYVKEKQGVLHQKKYTEYSRTVIGLTAIGKDPRNVGGYDVLKPLGDYDKTIWQGLNGPIWALLALDSGNYPMPQNPEAKTQATRQMYVDCILNAQLNDGGWTLSRHSAKDPSDTDITGMALQALAKYQDQEKVAAAVQKALVRISEMQNDDGGFNNYYGDPNSESTVQLLVALCELGVDWKDERFVKNGHTMLDNLLTYRTKAGGFYHIIDGSDGDNQMSAEQGFYGLVAALRFEKGMNSLYRMSDAISVGDAPVQEALTPGAGLPGKDRDVTPKAVTKPGITFGDITGSPNKAAIEALAAREIINGMGDGTFAPDATMTRAQYAAIVVRSLGLAAKANGKFRDVAGNAWYAGWVGTANTYGIVNGRSDTEFDPEGTITRQEAAVMTVRAAKLCGLDTTVSSYTVLDTLCDYTDYRSVASWAQEAMAWCCLNEVTDTSVLKLEPGKAILRGEVAEMLYRMLVKANLI